MFNRESTPTTNRIMKSIKNLLPALALVLGASMAMAMNVPSVVAEKNATKIWTADPSQTMTNGYRDVTGSTYLCNEGSPECVVKFENDDPYDEVIQVTPGSFVAL